MNIPNPTDLESQVCQPLIDYGWRTSEGDSAAIDYNFAILPADLQSWLQETQPQAWKLLEKKHGAQIKMVLQSLVREQLDQHGTLEVLRLGLDLPELEHPLRLANFKTLAENRLRIIRQLPLADSDEDRIGLVFFFNGLPIATAELKSKPFESLYDLIDKYRGRRTKLGTTSPLFSFPNGALFHLAVSGEAAAIATHLSGANLGFFPWKAGTAFSTFWEPEAWLEILGRYLFLRKNEEQVIEELIFPQPHQLEMTHNLQEAILQQGPGGQYLIQHAPGTGTTNSIAWSARFLAELEDPDDGRVFDKVIVVSERGEVAERILEVLQNLHSQISEEAIAGFKNIVVYNDQMLAETHESILNLTRQGQRFAVIVDGYSRPMKEGAKAEMLLADSLITGVLFHPTPSLRILEHFGTRPDAAQPVSAVNQPTPFHHYSRQQAIREDLLLDVLENYTNYEAAFHLARVERNYKGRFGGERYGAFFPLAQDGKSCDQTTVERQAARKDILDWIRQYPDNLSQKAESVVEHFRAIVAPLLAGEATALVVAANPQEAKAWQEVLEKYIADRNYRIQVEIDRRETALAGDGPSQLTLTTDRLPTGLFRSRLCGLYLDKKLADAEIVATFSQLNRSFPGKTTTYILDFENQATEVLAAFRKVDSAARISVPTDPHDLFDLCDELDSSGFYDVSEVDHLITLDTAENQEILRKTIAVVGHQLMKRYATAQESDALLGFKREADEFLRAYTFLSQVFNYRNTTIEKHAVFFRGLLPHLEFGAGPQSQALGQST